MWHRSSSLRLTARFALAVTIAATALGCATLSVEDERELGREYEQRIAEDSRMLYDDVIENYITSIGNGILRSAGPQPFEYRFSVVRDKDINAFAAPGGHIYLHTGLILKARNASELAGVIAHEIGHVTNRHIAEKYNKVRAADLGRKALVIGAGVAGGGNAAQGANLISGLGAMAVLNTFGREDEHESDAWAAKMLPRAGWDPRGLLTFFETMLEEEKEGGVHVPAFLSSHPTTTDRIASARVLIEAEDPPRGLKVHDNGRLEIIQRRIELLTGQRQDDKSGRPRR